MFTVENYYNYYSRIVFVENTYDLSPCNKTVYPTVYIQTKIKSAIIENKVHRYKIYLNKKLLNTFKAQNIEKNLLKEFCNKTNSGESISYMLFLNFLKTDYSYMNYEENQQIFAIIFWRYLCESNGIRFLNRGSLD